MKDLKAGFARKNRQDELTKKRRQELAKFRQMLCAVSLSVFLSWG